MVDQTLLDLDRRDRNLTVSKVREVLPEHYTSEYPNLVKFLEYYYDFMKMIRVIILMMSHFIIYIKY
jgi:hypothetical protein